MALTLEQEAALLALLDEKRITLPELTATAEIRSDDLMLTNQLLADKSITAKVLKDYIAPPATLDGQGIVQLSNAIDSDNEIVAATSKAVNKTHTLINTKLGQNDNLSDLTDKAKARTNLQLGSAALKNVGIESGQIPDMSSFLFKSITSQQGYQKLPSGLIIQWINGGSDSSGILKVTLPIPFSVGPLGGMANEGHPTGWTTENVTVWSFDLTSSTKTVAVARVRQVCNGGTVKVSSGIAGRILVWGY